MLFIHATSYIYTGLHKAHLTHIQIVVVVVIVIIIIIFCISIPVQILSELDYYFVLKAALDWYI